MKYYGEINPHKFDGDWHPSPPLEDDFIDGNFHNHDNHYRDYMLTSLVKAEIVKTLKLELSRYNCKKTVPLFYIAAKTLSNPKRRIAHARHRKNAYRIPGATLC